MSTVIRGPAALLDGYACAFLSDILRKRLVQARENNEHVDLEVAKAIRAVIDAGDAFRQGAPSPFPSAPFLDDETGYLSSESAAARLGVTSRTIRNYVRAGKLAGRKVNGHLRIDAGDVEKMQEKLNAGNSHRTLQPGDP